MADIFAIDIAAYAVMSNHYHVVVHIDQKRAEQWSDEEVAKRWHRLFSGTFLLNRYLSSEREAMGEAEISAVKTLIDTYRQRLYDLSWFMRCLNEHIARQANAEDGVKGRFWEGRFKSQALLDEQALLAAMVYVDMNPIRAAIAESPESSDYTSIQQRIQRTHDAIEEDNEALDDQQRPKQAQLMPFDATARSGWAIPFAYDDYLQLVDWTGRAIHPKKIGKIPDGLPEILHRLGFNGEAFIRYASRLLKEFGCAVGNEASMVRLPEQRPLKFMRGIGMARRVLSQAA